MQNNNDHENLRQTNQLSFVKIKKKVTMKRRVKRCFKTMSVGPLNNGLYFKKKQQYFSVCSGLFTVLGALGLIAIAIKTYVGIFNRDIVYADLNYKQFDVSEHQVSLYHFLDKVDLSFSVRAFSHWEME